MRQKEVLLIIPAYNEWLLMFLIWDMAVGCSLDINMQSEGAILMLFRWMRMGSTMCAISRKFTRD